MFLKKLKKDDSTWRRELKKGNFQPVKKWMIENVHSKGDLYDPADLVKEVCGVAMTVKPFLGYLENKFGKIYGF